MVLGKMFFGAIMLGYAASYVGSMILDDEGRRTAWVVGAAIGCVTGPFARMKFGRSRFQHHQESRGPQQDQGGRPAGLLFSFGMGVLVGFILGLILGGVGMFAYYSWSHSPWGQPVVSDDPTQLWIVLTPAVTLAALCGILFPVLAAMGKATRS